MKVELSSLTEMQKEFNGARIVFSVNVVGIIGHPSANKIFSKPHALCKDQLKIDHRSTYKTKLLNF